MNSVAIIHNPKILKSSLNGILRQIKKRHKKDFVVFVGDDPGQEQSCKKNRVFFLNISSLGRDINIEELSVRAFVLSRAWHKNFPWTYRNVNLAKFFESKIYISLVNILKSVEIIRDIFIYFKTNIVYLIDSVSKEHPVPDDLFFLMGGIFADKKNRAHLNVKTYTVRECGAGALYHNFRNKYFKAYFFWEKMMSKAKYRIKNTINAPATGTKKIAFLVKNNFDENYSHILDIVSKNTNYEICFLFQDLDFHPQNINLNGYKKYFSPKFYRTKEDRVFWQGFKKLKCDLTVGKSFSYKEFSIWDTTLNQVRGLFKDKLKRILGRIKYFEKIFQRENIKLIIGSETESDFNRILFLLASKMNIQTIDMQNDILLDESYNFIPKHSSKILVWDKATAMDLVGRGARESKIETLGKLKYLSYKEMSSPRKRQFCEPLGLNPKDKLILIALSGKTGAAGLNDPNVNGNLVKWAAELVNNSEGIQVIIRPHYTHTDDDVRFIKKLANGNAGKIFIDRESRLPDLLKNINLCVSGTSPLLLDAIYFNKPIIYVNTGAKNMLEKYTDKSVMVEVNNKIDFLKNVKLLLSSLKMNKELESNRLKFIKEYMPAVDPELKDRTVRIVESMMN